MTIMLHFVLECSRRRLKNSQKSLWVRRNFTFHSIKCSHYPLCRVPDGQLGEFSVQIRHRHQSNLADIWAPKRSLSLLMKGNTTTIKDTIHYNERLKKKRIKLIFWSLQRVSLREFTENTDRRRIDCWFVPMDGILRTMVRHNKIDHDVLNQFVATKWEHLKRRGNHRGTNKQRYLQDINQTVTNTQHSNHQDKLEIIGGWWLFLSLDPKPRHDATVAFRINLLLGLLDVRSIPECGWSLLAGRFPLALAVRNDA